MVHLAVHRFGRHFPAIVLLATLMLLLARPFARAQEAERVDGLTGRVSAISGKAYAQVLTATNGERYALLGETPNLEAQLAELAVVEATAELSGTLQTIKSLADLPILVVADIAVIETTSETLTTTPTPPALLTPQPTEGVEAEPTAPVLIVVTPSGGVPTSQAGTLPTATVAVYAVHLREGPGSLFAIIGVLRQGETCRVIARSPAPIWLQLECPEANGWVRPDLLSIDGTLGGVPLTEVQVTPPAPTPTPSPEPTVQWRVLAYPNRTLEGMPVVGFDTSSISYDWGLESPVPGVPVDNFSLRFDTLLRFAPGDYLFTLRYDDGARLSIGGQVVINDWNEGPERSSTWQGRLAGDLPVRLETFDAYHNAVVKLRVDRLYITEPATPPPPLTPRATPLPAINVPQDAWLATYFTNATLAGLPALSRTEPADDAGPSETQDRTPLARDYGPTSPAPVLLGLEGWSARWQGRYRFADGAYVFRLLGSGEARLVIDGLLVAEGALGPEGAPAGERVTLAEGWHDIVVELSDTTNPAAVRLEWSLLPSSETE